MGEAGLGVNLGAARARAHHAQPAPPFRKGTFARNRPYLARGWTNLALIQSFMTLTEKYWSSGGINLEEAETQFDLKVVHHVYE